MRATAANRFEMYPRSNARHLLGALVLLDLLLVLPLFGIGPTTLQQGAETVNAPKKVLTVPQALPAPASNQPPAAPAKEAPAGSMSAPTPEPPTGAVAPAASAKAATDAPPIATIHFDFDSDNLRAAARRRLTPIVEFLQTHPDATVRISGYHDARGSRVYNEDLAERRAIAVREALERDGIARGRIIVARPARTIGSGKPEQARRTEVTIVR